MTPRTSHAQFSQDNAPRRANDVHGSRRAVAGYNNPENARVAAGHELKTAETLVFFLLSGRPRRLRALTAALSACAAEWG